MVVKLDISKAYNQVEWGFLHQIILKIGLHPRWVDLAIEAVTTASYSVLINGEPRAFVAPSRGSNRATHYHLTYSCYVLKDCRLYYGRWKQTTP